MLGGEKTVLGKGKGKQRDQKGGCCENLDEDTLKTPFWENSGNRGVSIHLNAKPQEQVFLAFDLPRYHITERLSACYNSPNYKAC